MRMRRAPYSRPGRRAGLHEGGHVAEAELAVIRDPVQREGRDREPDRGQEDEEGVEGGDEAGRLEEGRHAQAQDDEEAEAQVEEEEGEEVVPAVKEGLLEEKSKHRDRIYPILDKKARLHLCLALRKAKRGDDPWRPP